MNAPDDLPLPDLADWLPASLRSGADDQTLIPRVAKDMGLMREIEASLGNIPTRHDVWYDDARAMDFLTPVHAAR